jgi:uncharacterized protein (TIGR00725 family)
MIAVCGPNEPTDEEIRLAEAAGAGVARAGHALVCGGRGGVMAAACRGAKGAGGTTVGVLPGYDRAEANEWVDHVVCTGLGHARNAVVVASGEAVIAVGGGFGTLSEIALALKMGKRVVALGGWPLDPDRVGRFLEGDAAYLIATRADEAVELAVAGIRAGRERPSVAPSGHG